MTRESLKSKLARDQPITGMMVFEFTTPGTPLVLARAGLDFVVFDMESSALSWESLRVLALASHVAGIEPMVRLGDSRQDTIGRALDLGVTGFMVPKIDTAADAAALASYARFPPLGTRGSGHDVGTGVPLDLPVVEKMAQANERVFLLCQIESTTAVESCGAIAAVPGIDALSVGINDLTASMGIPGQFDNPAYVAAVDRVRTEALAHGKAFGAVVPTPGATAEALATGQRVLFVKHDRALLGEAIKPYVQALR